MWSVIINVLKLFFKNVTSSPELRITKEEEENVSVDEMTEFVPVFNLVYPEVTLEQLKAILSPFPGQAARYVEHLNRMMEKYEINTRLRQAHFLAQICHGSGRFVFNKELGGPTARQKRYEPVTSLSRTLGNTEPGDGFRFRGRGLIQLTGRANYTKYAEYLSETLGRTVTAEEVAALLEEDKWTADVAGWFWTSRKLNEWADQDDILEITRRINGGFNGINDRRAFLAKAKQVFSITT
jgi:putative chitinase